jgi:Cu-Zn family superoxide dismutase
MVYKMFASVRWGNGENGISTDQIEGHVSFSQQSPDQDVRVYVYIEGLPEGVHGFHVHEKPLEDTDGDVMDCCDKLGGHFNVGEKWSPENQSGTRHGPGGHNGDLCNNIYSDGDLCEIAFSDSKISLFPEDERCIVGRSIVIHEDPDDLGLPEYEDKKKNISKLITGNAGKRIACGNIEVGSDED